MTDTHHGHQPLGVGTLLNDTFSISLRHLHWFAVLAFGPLVFAGLVAVALGGSMLVAGQFNLDAFDQNEPTHAWGIAAILIFVYVICAALATAMIASAAYDARLGRSMRIGFYVSLAARRIVPVVLCSMIAIFFVYVGLILVVVPGLWVMAVYFVLIPVIVIEGDGLAALGRSVRLTKGYRWPIVGYFLVLWVCISLINLLTGFITDPLFELFGDIPGTILSTVLTVLTTSFLFVGPAMVYARLIEIKEGEDSKRVEVVFE
jgi:hypothetical protein